MARRKKTDWREMVETCSFFFEFIDIRYTERPSYKVRVPAGPERTFHDAVMFCGNIDSDGFDCLLVQPLSDKRRMYSAMRELGLDDVVDNAEKAEKALTNAGLSLRRKSDRNAIEKILQPYEKKYFGSHMVKAYRRLNKYLGEHIEFAPYAHNCARMEKQGGNPFDFTEWSEEKLEEARRLSST